MDKRSNSVMRQFVALVAEKIATGMYPVTAACRDMQAAGVPHTVQNRIIDGGRHAR